MEIKPLHAWDLEPAAAMALQRELAQELSDELPISLDDIRLVAGVDVSVKQGVARAAVAVMRYPQLDLVEVARAGCDVAYPYVPGLLAFREAPAILAALKQLHAKPDVYLFDGMGRIHPRGIGIAAHLGLWLGAPTLGCGKSHYIGEYDMPGLEKGSRSPLTYEGRQLGSVLRTRANVKPVYISAGHHCDLDSALRLCLACVTRYRLPEPIRAAHKAAKIT